MSIARHGGQARPLNGPLIALLALTLAVRCGVLAISPRALEDDPDGYRAVAENLLRHGTFGEGNVPTAYRPPLYPLMLAPCLALGPWSRTAIGVLHVGLGVATVWLTFRVAQRWGLGRWALPAALLAALDPILLRQSTLIMTETPAAFLAVAALALLTAAGRRPSAGRALAAGACVALAALCRPAFLPWLGSAAVILPWSTAKAHGLQPVGFTGSEVIHFRVFKVLFAFIIGAAIVLAPWVVRNQLQLGRPIVSTTHGGYTLWLANNPDLYEHLRTGAWGSLWNADEFNKAWRAAPRASPPDELAADRLAYSRAWEAIRAQPGMFLYSCMVRVGGLWTPLPHQLSPDEAPTTRMARYAVAVWYTVEMLLAGVGALLLVRLTSKRGRTGLKPVPHSKSSEVFKSSEVCAESAGLLAGEGPGEGALTQTLSQRERGPGWIWGLLLVVCFTGVHTLYWTDMRMRAPLVPVVAMGAAAGVAGSLGRLRRPK